MISQHMAIQEFPEPWSLQREDTGGPEWHKMSKTMSKGVQTANVTK